MVSAFLYRLAGLGLNLLGVILFATPSIGYLRQNVPIIRKRYQSLSDEKESLKEAKNKLFAEGHVTNEDTGFENLASLIKDELGDYGTEKRINRREYKGVVQVIYDDRNNSDELPDEHLINIMEDEVAKKERFLKGLCYIIGILLAIVGVSLQMYASSIDTSTLFTSLIFG